MVGYSVKYQYCDLKHGEWKQNVYPFSETCQVKWYTKLFSPQEQVFFTDRYRHGLKLDYCNEGPCPDDPNSIDADSGIENEQNAMLGHVVTTIGGRRRLRKSF